MRGEGAPQMGWSGRAYKAVVFNLRTGSKGASPALGGEGRGGGRGTKEAEKTRRQWGLPACRLS